jgi:protein TonB
VGQDGIPVAHSPEGIAYQILRQHEPAYPARAEQMRISGTVSVTAKFLVGLSGNVEQILILSGNKGLGFDDEVTAALRRWKFRPVYYQNRNIKVWFTKTFRFLPKR